MCCYLDHLHQGTVSQKSRNFSGLFRVPQFSSVSSQCQGPKPSNFAILLVFFFRKHVKRSTFQIKRISLTTGFRGPKSYRDFRETGPQNGVLVLSFMSIIKAIVGLCYSFWHVYIMSLPCPYQTSCDNWETLFQYFEAALKA